MACRTGVPPSTRTFLGAPPTPRFGVSEAKSQTPGAENAPRERDGLFDIVRRSASAVAVIVPSPLAGEGRSALPRTGEGYLLERNPSPIRVWWVRHCALSRLGRGHERRHWRIWPNKNQPAAVGTDRGLRSIVFGLLFTMNGATPTCWRDHREDGGEALASREQPFLVGERHWITRETASRHTGTAGGAPTNPKIRAT